MCVPLLERRESASTASGVWTSEASNMSQGSLSALSALLCAARQQSQLASRLMRLKVKVEVKVSVIQVVIESSSVQRLSITHFCVLDSTAYRRPG